MVAHVAVLRRFLQIDGRALLVGDVGLVAVDPARQGCGLGAALWHGSGRRSAASAAVRLPDLRRAGGGLLRPRRLGRVPGPTRMVRADGRVQVYGGVSMVLALATGIDAWPAGRVDRNGWEV